MSRWRAWLVRALGGRRWSFAVVGIGLAIRILALALLAPFPFVGDERSYHVMAGQLLEGVRFAPDWPPGLPYYLALFRSISGGSHVVAMAAMIPWYLVFSALLYALCVRIRGRHAANIALTVFAVYPTFVYHSVIPLTQLPVAACLLLVALLMLSLKEKRSLGASLAMGAALGVCVLLRPSAALLAASIPAFILIRWRSPGSALAVLAVAALLVLPWEVKVHAMTGDVVALNYATSRNLYIGNSPWTPLYKTWWFGSHEDAESVPPGFRQMDGAVRALPPSLQDTAYRRLAVEHIMKRPDLFVLRTLNRVRTYFAFDTYAGTVLVKFDRLPKLLGLAVIAADAIFYFVIMALSLVAFLAPEGLRIERAAASTLLLITVAYALPYWVAFSHPTYHFPVVPLLAVPAAVLVSDLLAADRASLRTAVAALVRRRSIGWALAVLLAIQLEWLGIMGSRLLGKGS
jgi:4-amino-4-deoxy-L-arabinose transferase-like glycosyltransferase